jgi:hypothetical protein
MCRRLLFCALLLCAPLAVAAQIEIDPRAAKADAAKTEQIVAAAISSSPRAETYVVKAAYERYYMAALMQRSDAFAWQAFASKVIFWMVLILVTSGLTFSGVQFWIALRSGTLSGVEKIELSLQKLKVRSQSLGVVTLTLSLAFFYLYLATVYPVVEVGKPEVAAELVKSD